MNFAPSKTNHEESKIIIGFTTPTYAVNIALGDVDENEDCLSDEEFEVHEIKLGIRNSRLMIQSPKKRDQNGQQQLSSRQESSGNVLDSGKQTTHQSSQQLFKVPTGQLMSSKENKKEFSVVQKSNQNSQNMKNNRKQSSSFNNSPQTIKSPQTTQGNLTQRLQSHKICSQTYHRNPFQSFSSSPKSFEQSYQDMAKKILIERAQNNQNLSLSIHDLLICSEDINMFKGKKQIDKKTQLEFLERLNQKTLHQQQEKLRIASSQEQKIMQECTFVPNVRQKERKIQNMENPSDSRSSASQQYSKKYPLRSLETFLADQIKFQKNKSNRINYLKFRIQEEEKEILTHKPIICASSEAIINSKRTEKEQFHERLYKTNSEVALLEQKNSFKPLINKKSRLMQRKGKVCEHLYQDAQRRQENQLNSFGITNSSHQREKLPKDEVLPKKTLFMVATRFVREFEAACDQILVDPSSQEIGYIQISQILQKLNFLTDKTIGAGMCSERQLIHNMWLNLRGDVSQNITKCNACQFLLIILGIFGYQLQLPDKAERHQDDQEMIEAEFEDNEYFSNDNIRCIPRFEQRDSRGVFQPYKGEFCQQVVEEEEDEEEEDKEHLEIFLDKTNHEYIFRENNEKELPRNAEKKVRGVLDALGNWNISLKEAKILNKEFNLFYFNRLSAQKARKPNNETKSHQNNDQLSVATSVSATSPLKTTTPTPTQFQMLPHSRKLADKHREKLIFNLEQNSTNPQNLSEGNISHADLLVLQKKMQIQERERKQKEIQASDQKRDQSMQTQKNVEINSVDGMRKSEQLFELAKLKASQQKQDRHTNDIEFERDFDECTFQPNTPKNGKQLMSNNPIDIPQVQQVSVFSVKNADKNIERIRAANTRKRIHNEWLSRGYTQSSMDHIRMFKEINKEKLQINTDSRNTLMSRGLENIEDIELFRQQFQSQDPSNSQNLYADFSQPPKTPQLFVDVNLGSDRLERITIFEGDEASQLASEFIHKHKLGISMKEKLKDLLDQQIKSLLEKIEEEESSLFIANQQNEEQEYH